MKVSKNRIKVEVTFEDNEKLNSMYVLRYLADKHTDGCVAAYVYKAVSSWIKLHHETDLLDQNVADFISRTKGTLTGGDLGDRRIQTSSE